MMRVTDVLKLMTRLKKAGKGNYPVEIMVVEDGVTYAQSVHMHEAASYDGKRVWVYGTDELQSPEWLKNRLRPGSK